DSHRHAVDAPFDSTNALAFVGDPSLDRDNLFCGLAADRMRGYSNHRRWPAVQNSLQVHDLGRLLYFARRIPSQDFAKEIGIKERLANLIDQRDIQAPDYRQNIAVWLRSSKEPHLRDGRPASITTSSKG